jgi:chromosome segregation ATPase
MALFLEWYLFDNYLIEKSKTVLEVLIDENRKKWPSEKLEIIQSIAETIQGLFLVKTIKDQEVKVLNLFTDKTYIVQEKESRLIFRKNDLFQGRIIFFEEKFYFTGNYCFHPKQTHKCIKPQIKEIAKIQNQQKTYLGKLEKLLLKENKKSAKQEAQIEKLNGKISQAGANKTKLNQRLLVLKEKKNSIDKGIKDLEKDILVLKHEKIRVEGNQQINKLINKFAYMNLKWERSRQIDAWDIYNN